MKQLLIEIDAETAARLEKVAPSRSRRRSQFIRSAIRRALWDVEEAATEQAYRRQPDLAEEAFDPAAWAPSRPAPPLRRKPR
jgi:predicted transcriptional regulator